MNSFALVWLILCCRSFMPNHIYIYIYIYIYNLVWLDCYGISTIVVYLMPNPLYTYMLNIYDFVGFGFMHINHCRLFNPKPSLYIYIKYIGLGLFGFYSISTIVGYLSKIFFIYIYILNIYNVVFMVYQLLYVIKCQSLVWFGCLMAHRPL